jgi:thiamine kinase-like enzyme
MESVLELVATQLGWEPQQLQLEFQESGLTNRNYVVSNGSEKVVVRVNGAHTETLGINREAELAAMEALSGLGIAPEVLYFNTERGDMITRYIEGHTWESGDLAPNIERISALLKKAHMATGINFEFSPYQDIERWIQLAENRGRQLPESLDKLMERLRQIQALRAAASEDFRGLCHNDPFANNFMDEDSGTLRLLDWEFAGMGDILYDLACIGQSMREDQQLELLHAYFGYTSTELLQGLQDMDYVVSFWNAMWAVTLLDPLSQQDFDYAKLADYLFRKLEKIVEQQ